jgi:hypothetical protein
MSHIWDSADLECYFWLYGWQSSFVRPSVSNITSKMRFSGHSLCFRSHVTVYIGPTAPFLFAGAQRLKVLFSIYDASLTTQPQLPFFGPYDRHLRDGNDRCGAMRCEHRRLGSRLGIPEGHSPLWSLTALFNACQVPAAGPNRI